MNSWRRLDETRAEDLEAFHALPIVLAALYFVGVLVALITPILAAIGLAYAPLLGASPLPLLILNLAASRSPAGRGAMWTFGKGWSPSQQLVGQTVLVVLGAVVFVVLAVLTG